MRAIDIFGDECDLADAGAEPTSVRHYPAAIADAAARVMRHKGGSFLWSDDGSSFQVKCSRYVFEDAIREIDAMAGA